MRIEAYGWKEIETNIIKEKVKQLFNKSKFPREEAKKILFVVINSTSTALIDDCSKLFLRVLQDAGDSDVDDWIVEILKPLGFSIRTSLYPDDNKTRK